MDNPYYGMWLLQKERIAQACKDNRQPENVRKTMMKLLIDMTLLETQVILEQ